MAVPGGCPGGGKKWPKLSRLGELLNTQKNVHFFPPRGGRPGGAPRGGPGGVPGTPLRGGQKGTQNPPFWGGPVIQIDIYRPPRGVPRRGSPGGSPGGSRGGPRGVPRGGRPGGARPGGARGAPARPRKFSRARSLAPPPGRGGSRGGTRGVPVWGLSRHSETTGPVSTDPVCDTPVGVLPTAPDASRPLRGWRPVAPRHVVQWRDVTLCLGDPAPRRALRGHGDPLVRMHATRSRQLTACAALRAWSWVLQAGQHRVDASAGAVARRNHSPGGKSVSGDAPAGSRPLALARPWDRGHLSPVGSDRRQT